MVRFAYKPCVSCSKTAFLYKLPLSINELPRQVLRLKTPKTHLEINAHEKTALDLYPRRFFIFPAAHSIQTAGANMRPRAFEKSCLNAYALIKQRPKL